MTAFYEAVKIDPGGNSMVSFEDLRKMFLLQNLSDSMLGKMLPFAQVRIFGERSVIFKEGDFAEIFYMLLKGKVLLEVEVSETVNVSLGAIKPGYSFGWSALIPGSSYTSYAVCVEPCEVITIPGNRILQILDQDTTMGYQIMTGVVAILKRRLERRTGQFLKTLRTHPDIEKIF
ncbi:MAG: cyclic nucleotide-binding domain-containing protein [Pseudomonadota bacterium]